MEKMKNDWFIDFVGDKEPLLGILFTLTMLFVFKYTVEETKW